MLDWLVSCDVGDVCEPKSGQPLEPHTSASLVLPLTPLTANATPHTAAKHTTTALCLLTQVLSVWTGLRWQASSSRRLRPSTRACQPWVTWWRHCSGAAHTSPSGTASSHRCVTCDCVAQTVLCGVALFMYTHACSSGGAAVGCSAQAHTWIDNIRFA